MAFPSRRKTKRNESDNEYSTQLINKPARPNTASTHYATFANDNNGANSMQQRFKISNLRIRNKDKTLPGNNFLAPKPYSQPVTPTQPVNQDNSENVDAMVSNTLLTLQRAVSSKEPQIKQPNSTKSVPIRPKTSYTHNHPPFYVQDQTSKSHSNMQKQHPTITPQLWDDISSNSFKVTDKQRSNSNTSPISYGKFAKKNKIFPSTPGIKASTPGSKTVGYPVMDRVQTSREHNKRFILERIQNQNNSASLFRRRSVVSNYTKTSKNSVDYDQKFSLQSHMSYSINEEAQYENYEMVTQKPTDYNLNQMVEQFHHLRSDNNNSNQWNNNIPQTRRTTTSTKRGINSREQLVYIGGINDINKFDVRDRLYDLFEIWGDRPDICPSDLELWNTDCIYVRYPSIAQAIDGINVFDGLQPNGYILSAELVLEGSQMVYIDGLDGDWNEEIFKNFVDINNDYKVSIKCNKGDDAYAFVQFSNLEAVQSAIDRFDGETEIDGKLVRWEHMVKAYIGKIGENTTTNDIQNELSEFDASFKYLPVEIRKSREPMYYDHQSHRQSDTTTQQTVQTPKKQQVKKKYSNISRTSIDEEEHKSHHIVEQKSKSNSKNQSKNTRTVPHTPSLSTIESSRLILADKSHSNLYFDNMTPTTMTVDMNATQLKTQWSDSLENQITPVQTTTTTGGGAMPDLTLKSTPFSHTSNNFLYDGQQQTNNIRTSIPMLDETKMVVDDEDLLMNTQTVHTFGKKKEHTRGQSSTLSSVNPTPVPSDSEDMDSNDDENIKKKNNISNLRVQMRGDELVSSSNDNSDETVSDSSDSATDLTEDTMEFEWHYYAYVWFWTKTDAMRAQIRFDKRNCFGAILPVRFLLMNDMTQKVYVSGLMEGYTSENTIENDIFKYISEKSVALWRKKCIVTYRPNGSRPFAYLRFPSMETTREAIELFDNKICFGNQNALINHGGYGYNKDVANRIHLEFVKDASDLLSHGVSRKWNRKQYWYLVFSFLFLPITLIIQWIYIETCHKRAEMYNKIDKYNTTKDLASFDLLSAMFCFNDSFRLKLKTNKLIRFIFIILSIALYIIFYFLLYTMTHNIKNLDVLFTALLPILLYFVLIQLMSCWCSMCFEVAFPQFHVLEHVSMYFEDSILYSRIHIMASDFATSKQWNEIKYPWEYPIEYKKRIIILALIYPLILRIPLLYYDNNNFITDHTSDQKYNGWDIVIEIFSATLMFGFCYILFCAFNTITLRTLSYWKQVHGITELITLKINNLYENNINNINNNNHENNTTCNNNFLRLDNENNLFAWLSLRSFIHRKGDVVFCGLEMQALFLIIMVFVNIGTIMIFVIVIFEAETALLITLLNSGFILTQLYFLCVCIYYVAYVLMIGYWFGKENEDQLNRVERQKLFLSTETMKQYLNYEKYKLCDDVKVRDMKLLLNSMDALVQHVETKEITPQLWGIKMNDFKWKIVITMIAAVIPSIAVRLMLNV